MRANTMTIRSERPSSRRAIGRNGTTDATSRLITTRTAHIITTAIMTASLPVRVVFVSQAATNRTNHAPDDHSHVSDGSGSIYDARSRTIASQSAVVGDRNDDVPDRAPRSFQSSG